MIGIADYPDDFESMSQVYDFIDSVKNLNSAEYDKPVVTIKDIESSDKQKRSQIELAVREAIKHPERIEVYYQPIYSVSDMTCTSAEALLRINDPTLGIISPGEFIQLAEVSGNIVQLGILTFDKVCSFYSSNNLQMYGIKCVHINLSVFQCMFTDMCDAFSATMKKYSISPDCISLEITESSVSYTPKILQINMTSLHNQGVKFALDDYGTGFSSVNHIVELPFESVKLSRSMLTSACSNNTKARIAFQSSVKMLHNMNMRVVAEGVETKEELDFLKDVSCDYMQGYYFCYPMSSGDFLDFLKRH
jgi:EAL domain-containing protein (putative c-di-GMP-specific phosphodiesterase class I)